jgi:hypothetical protein
MRVWISILWRRGKRNVGLVISIGWGKWVIKVGKES